MKSIVNLGENSNKGSHEILFQTSDILSAIVSITLGFLTEIFFTSLEGALGVWRSGQAQV